MDSYNTLRNKFFSYLKKSRFELIENLKFNERVAHLRCKKCGTEFFISVASFLKENKNSCPTCRRTIKKVSESEMRQLMKEKEREDYELLKYKGFDTQCLVRHKCGFVFSVNAEKFIEGKGCPKCFRLNKGKTKIIQFLQDNEIEFEYNVKIDGRNFDFLIPDKKILIDYITGYKKLGNQYKINFCEERGYKLIEIPLSSQNDIASVLNVCRHNINENVGEVNE